MTLNQICAQCTDRACHLCPISKPCARCEFRTGAPSAKRLTDLFGDTTTQTFAPLTPAHRHDVELDRYYADLDMDGGDL